jgi:hypothetical protein
METRIIILMIMVVAIRSDNTSAKVKPLGMLEHEQLHGQI